MTSSAPANCGKIKTEGEREGPAVEIGCPQLTATDPADGPTTRAAAVAQSPTPLSSGANNVAAAAAAASSSPLSPYTGRQMSRQLLEEFMIAYRHNQCLWKIKSKDYLNKELKFKAYKQLVQICRKEHRAAGREFVVKKINSLRGSFRREYKRVISEENYVPQLWFYDLMQFTADQETSDEIDSAAAAAAVGQSLMVIGSGGAVGLGAGMSAGSSAFGLAGGCYDYQTFGGDEALRDKFKSEDDDNSNSNLSFQILHHSAYSDAVTAASAAAATNANPPAALLQSAPVTVSHSVAGPITAASDDYSNCLENDTVEQELIINSSNPMVDGNGPEAAAASAAAISESTSVGLDYIANSLNIQHHETCPSVAVADAVLDDAVVEEGIIEPDDVILPANLLSDDSPSTPGDDDVERQQEMQVDFGAAMAEAAAGMSGDEGAEDPAALLTAVAEGFSNGARGGIAAGSAIATAGRSASGAFRSHRGRRALRRYSGGADVSCRASDTPTAIICTTAATALDQNNSRRGPLAAGDHRYDEFMAFGVTVAAKLSRMNVYQRLYAENIINQTLFRGMLNQLQPPPADSDTYHQQQHQPQPAVQQFHAPDVKVSPDFGGAVEPDAVGQTTTIKRESPS